jgi:opacity protein-like surface antigen
LFGQVLVGRVRASSITPSWPGSVGKSDNKFTVQPGGGVDFWVVPHLGVRGEVAYRRVSFDIRPAIEPVVRVGLVLGM